MSNKNCPTVSLHQGKRACKEALKQKEDNDATHLYEQFIQIPVITDYFLDFLPLTDILSCTLVSKEWNRLARDHIRRHRHCRLKCTLSDNQRPQELASLVENGILKDIAHVFTGFHFVIHAEVTGGLTPESMSIPYMESQVLPSLTIIMTKIKSIKRLVFELEEDFGTKKEYILFRVCDWIFSTLPLGDLESLRFSGTFFTDWDRIFASIPTRGLANLKRFEFEFDHLISFNDGGYAIILKQFPALSEFCMSVDIGNVGIFNKFNKLSTIKHVRVLKKSTLDSGNKELQILEEAKLQLEVFHVDSCQKLKPEQFQAVARILQPCSKSLKKFICRRLTYKQIFNIQIPPMPCVEEVVVYYLLQGEHEDDEYLESKLRQDEEAKLKIHPHLRQLFPNAVIIAMSDTLTKVVSVDIKPKDAQLHSLLRGLIPENELQPPIPQF